jgi:hypothetical protein
MALPGQIALSSRLRAAFTPVASLSPSSQPPVNSQLSQAIILGALIGFQVLDSFTTHLGLALEHEELNHFMAPMMARHGELVAYAIKGTALAMLLAVLMLTHRRMPRVWQAYLIGGWLSAGAVVANVLQLLL